MSDNASAVTGDYSLLGTFMRDTLPGEGVISRKDAEFIHRADSAAEAVEIIQSRLAGMMSSGAAP
jgi:hypothetical protein